MIFINMKNSTLLLSRDHDFFSKVPYLTLHIFCKFTELQGNELALITLFSYQLVLFLQWVWGKKFRKSLL